MEIKLLGLTMSSRAAIRLSLLLIAFSVTLLVVVNIPLQSNRQNAAGMPYIGPLPHPSPTPQRGQNQAGQQQAQQSQQGQNQAGQQQAQQQQQSQQGNNYAFNPSEYSALATSYAARIQGNSTPTEASIEIIQLPPHYLDTVTPQPIATSATLAALYPQMTRVSLEATQNSLESSLVSIQATLAALPAANAQEGNIAYAAPAVSPSTPNNNISLESSAGSAAGQIAQRTSATTAASPIPTSVQQVNNPGFGLTDFGNKQEVDYASVVINFMGVVVGALGLVLSIITFRYELQKRREEQPKHSPVRAKTGRR